MDATTNQKTLSGVLVTLLLASVLLPAASAVHAGAPNPTSGVSAAWVDVGPATVSTTVGAHTASTNVQSVITFATPYDLTITNIPGVTLGQTLNLFRNGSSDLVSATTIVEDLEHAGRFNATFANQALNAVGFWYVNASGGGNVATFVVTAQPNLQVTLSPSSFPYSTTPVSYTITVTNLSTSTAGAPVAGAALSGAGIATGLTTDSAGTRTIFGALPEAGVHLIQATRDYNGDGVPELTGNTTLTVTPAALTVVGSNTVVAGFTDVATWDVRFPTGTNVFGNSGGAINSTSGVSLFQWANLTVAMPNGTSLFVNMTTGATGGICGVAAWASTLNTAVREWNGTTCYAPADTPLLTFATSGANVGRISFRPGTTWTAGTYSFNLAVSTIGGTSGGVFNSAPEYAAAWSQATTPPQAVNLKAFEGTGQITSDNGFSVREADLNPTGGTSLGHYDVRLSVIGSTATEFPGSAPWHAFGPGNVTVTGDVLTGTGFNVVSTTALNTAGTGNVEITNVVPTKVNGVVNFIVTWKNQTTTLSLPVTRGADSSANQAEIVVDQPSTLTITVRDTFGNPVPTATINVADPNGGPFPGAEGFTINGTGAPGLGQNGQYTLNVRPTSTGDMVVYSTIGSIVGTADNRNFSYVKVRVAPAHDLVVTLGTNESLAGNLTYVYLNATMTGGHAVTTASNYRAYFLNQTTLNELRINGTSALAGIGAAAPSFQSLSGAGTGVQSTVSLNTLAGAHLNVSLDPGTWYVYVCSNMTGTDCTTAKHDNINNTPSFVATPWHAAFSPPQISNNAQLQSNVPVTVKVTDPMNASRAAPQGTLVRVRAAATTGAVTPVLGTMTLNSTGEATFTVTGSAIGDLVFETDISGGASHWTALDTPFKVVGPNVQVNPDRIPLGRPATLIITVRSLNGTALPNLQVQVCGTPLGGTDVAPGCTGNVSTDANGLATVGVNPLFTGNMTLRVSGVDTNVNVTVFAGLDIQFSRPNPSVGDTQDVTVGIIGQLGGVSGIAVNVSYNGTAVSGFPQNTDSNGRVVVPNLRAGNYTVTATRQGFDPATRTFTVATATNDTGPQFSLSNLRVPANANVGQAISVSADVTNNGTESGTANVLLVVNGAVRDTRQVPVAANGRETVEFDFTPNTAGTFNVTVRLATGETVAPRTVTVTTPPTGTPVTTSPVTTSPVTTSPVTTSPVTTSPPVGTTPATGTPTTTTPPSPEVPGFEVVALVGALAVAMLVLRRRS